MMEITEFLENRLREDEEAAQAAATNLDGQIGEWSIYSLQDGTTITQLTASGCSDKIIWTDDTRDAHIVRWQPKRVLAEIAAKRAILQAHKVNSEPEMMTDPKGWGSIPTGQTDYWCNTCDHDRDYGHIGGEQEGCDTLRQIASVYSDHPDYRSEWVVA